MTTATLTNAKPRRVRVRAFGDQPAVNGWAWYACGGDNYGLAPHKGIIPVDVAARLPPSTVTPPPGCGGRWYRTKIEAMTALSVALAEVERPTHDIGGEG